MHQHIISFHSTPIPDPGSGPPWWMHGGEGQAGGLLHTRKWSSAPPPCRLTRSIKAGGSPEGSELLTVSS